MLTLFWIGSGRIQSNGEGSGGAQPLPLPPVGLTPAHVPQTREVGGVERAEQMGTEVHRKDVGMEALEAEALTREGLAEQPLLLAPPDPAFRIRPNLLPGDRVTPHRNRRRWMARAIEFPRQTHLQGRMGSPVIIAPPPAVKPLLLPPQGGGWRTRGRFF